MEDNQEYVVFNTKDMDKYLTRIEKELVYESAAKIWDEREKESLPEKHFFVVEHDKENPAFKFFRKLVRSFDKGWEGNKVA